MTILDFTEEPLSAGEWSEIMKTLQSKGMQIIVRAVRQRAAKEGVDIANRMLAGGEGYESMAGVEAQETAKLHHFLEVIEQIAVADEKVWTKVKISC